MTAALKFTRGVPPLESFPGQQLAVCMQSAMEKYGDVIQQYNPSAGFLPLRQYLAAENDNSAGNVLIGQGSLQLLDLAARYFLAPSDAVFVELPTYDRALTVLRRAGADVVGFDLQTDGPDPEAMERYIQAHKPPKFAYLIPDFQNPSGQTMAAEKRAAIVALAEKYNFWIFEDSPYRKLRYHGEELPSLYQLGAEKVVMMSSFSKTICPGLRVGYMVVPAPLYQPLASMAEDTYINSSYINQAIVFEYIERGWFDENLSKLLALYRHRLNAMLGSLQAQFSRLGTWSNPEGGFFVGLRLEPFANMNRLCASAAEDGLILTDSRGFFADGSGEDFVRLPFCGLSPQEIQIGVERLAGVVRRLERS